MSKTPKHLFLLVLIFAAVSLSLSAQDKAGEDAKVKEMIRIAKSINYQKGTFVVADGTIIIKLSEKYRWLSPADTDKLMHGLWNNPPDPSYLGMIVPVGFNPFAEDCWAVALAFSDDGYVSDEDARKIDYNKLLETMQEGAINVNEERKKGGYPEIHIVGWATPPKYDEANHKLFWAKEIKFSNNPINTLNYYMRVLGRRGVLEMNAIANIGDLPVVQTATPELLSFVNFSDGNRYADYNNDTDKTATYGIAALIGGVALVKTGLLKGLWIALLASKKLILFAILALGASIKKLWNRLTGARPKEEDMPTPPGNQP